MISFSKPDINKEEKKAILDVLKSDWPSQGKTTEKFESLLSNYLSSNVVVVNNGSSALMAALLAHGLKPGDRIVVPSFTFVATSSIPKILGAKVHVADVDKTTFNISLESVEKLVKKNNIKMVIIVDVGGLSVDIEAFRELSNRYKFVLIEDAAQAFGSTYKNKKSGSFDHTTIFSFQTIKLITTIEGGCISTKDKKIINRIRQIKDYGRNKYERYVHDIVGTNFRTTDLQSAIGIQQLKKVEQYISRRNMIADIYRKKIKNVQFQVIPEYSTRHTCTLFFAMTKSKSERDRFVKHLISKKIDARKPWRPIHMQPCNPEMHNSSCKNAEDVFERSFLLPIYNSMNISESKFVIDSINEIQK
ncbi:Putative pyridoxal phosphate-dependent aminotransferase [Nitrosotalea devaniterrae]|uniref:Pyridoxal phosphate-dependent aminotransferase n=1 Tax=Nitrosotalea devaniterrae TaxID=1078905 RepID=A0A128A0N6_9ARCH|nr:Putative pyridoxal phosphate-dependent aminotransferase [Candidatus Nitrosotalea devanaterra]